MNRWTRNTAQRREDYYYEALAFSWHNINLVFDEQTMEPERVAKAPENASIDPSHDNEEMVPGINERQ